MTDAKFNKYCGDMNCIILNMTRYKDRTDKNAIIDRIKTMQKQQREVTRDSIKEWKETADGAIRAIPFIPLVRGCKEKQIAQVLHMIICQNSTSIHILIFSMTRYCKHLADKLQTIFKNMPTKNQINS